MEIRQEEAADVQGAVEVHETTGVLLVVEQAAVLVDLHGVGHRAGSDHVVLPFAVERVARVVAPPGTIVSAEGPREVVGACMEIVRAHQETIAGDIGPCLLYTSPSPRDRTRSRMPSSA